MGAILTSKLHGSILILAMAAMQLTPLSAMLPRALSHIIFNFLFLLDLRQHIIATVEE
jgi:hypothetical protein